MNPAAHIPTLLVQREGASRCDIDPADPHAEVWKDADGTLAAVGLRSGTEYCFDLAGVGHFQFDPASKAVRVSPIRDVADHTLSDAFLRTIVPLYLQVCGFEVLHASAFETAAGIVALCGVKETGKSTIAYALSRRGYPIWADDAVVFHAHEREALAFQLPFRTRLRPASANFFGVEPRLTTERVSSTRCEARRLLAVCVMERVPGRSAGSAAEVQRLNGATAFAAALAHGYCFSLRDAVRKQTMMTNYIALASSVPIFSVRYATGLEHLSEILESLEAIASCVVR